MGFNMVQPTNPICPKDQGHQSSLDSHHCSQRLPPKQDLDSEVWLILQQPHSGLPDAQSYTQSAHFVASTTPWASIRRRRIQADTPENHGNLKVPKQSLLSLLQVCCADAHREGSWAETLESLCTDCCQRETKKFKEKCSNKFGNEWCSHGYTSVRSLHSRFRDSQILIFDLSMQKEPWLPWSVTILVLCGNDGQ